MKLDNPKLLSLAQAQRLRQRVRRSGEKVVLTNGVFDLLHPGHTSYLAVARKSAGKNGRLIVALNSDRSVKKLKGKLRPIMDQKSRAYNLAQLRSVDAVVIFGGKRLSREIERLKPDIYCKAGDYTIETLDFEERAALERVHAQIRFLPFLPGFSTTKLINKIKAAGTL